MSYFWKAIVTIGLILTCIMPKYVHAAETLHQDIFGYKSIPYTDLSAFTKWSSMLARYQKNLKKASETCLKDNSLPCLNQKWKAKLDQMKTMTATEQIQAVNKLFNRSPYINDSKNWGVSDYWATPFEFLTVSGDCEDYAIIKYMSLKYLGHDTSNLRIVILNDRNLGIAHAILAAWTGSDFLILDNQIRTAISQNRIAHYEPIFSISEKNWWLHKPL